MTTETREKLNHDCAPPHPNGELVPWPRHRRVKDKLRSGDDYDVAREEIRQYAGTRPWVWPERRLFFFSDLHADADAFLNSLVASSGAIRTGEKDEDFELTALGREAQYVIGGDCFDKGPHNLRLIRALKALIDKGADVEILAGNHDLRTFVGLFYSGRKETRYAHLFVRMGRKTIPLFREIFEEYVADSYDESKAPTMDELSRDLFPDEDWYRDFPAAVEDLVPELKIRKEVIRIREKANEFIPECEAHGLTLAQVHAALLKARELFSPQGEFGWFFSRMNVAMRAGSFLLVHAGVDDTIASLIRRDGVDGLNRRFHELLVEDPFELYHGPIGSAFRTKYRNHDFPLSSKGIADMHHAGLYGIVHGHKNVVRGHRLVMRNGLLNVECDVSLDRNTRRLEALDGPGVGVLIFDPGKTLRGISGDSPGTKLFDAREVFDTTFLPGKRKRRGVKTPRPTESNKELEMDQAPETDRETTDEPAIQRLSKIRYEATMSREEAVSYFESIVEGLRKGSMRISQGEGVLELNPSENLKVSVKASGKESKQKICFEMTWSDQPAEKLVILTGEEEGDEPTK